MLVASFVTANSERVSNRTYEDFYKLLGTNPKMMGVVAKMNTNNTINYLTEGLFNIFYNEKGVNKFQPIDSLEVQWELEVDFIKRVMFAAAPQGSGELGSDIKLYFTERYYEKYDTFVIEESGQQCIVKLSPERKADNFWEYVVTLIDSDYNSVLDTDACQPGMNTRFISNVQPEFHSEGYVKWQSNVEKMRTFIGEIRNDVAMSSRYDAFEDAFIKISKSEPSDITKEKIFKMNKAQKDLLLSHMEAKNNGLLFQKTTMDANGKCTAFTADGRPLIVGDGLIPQVERFASKMGYAVMGISVMNTVMNQMADKSESPTGNHWLFICNRVQYSQIQTALADWLKGWQSVPTNLYSKDANKHGNKAPNPLKVGATYTSYEVMGNVITFAVDNSLTKYYPSKGYGICLDVTPDMTTGHPAVAAFTLKGKEFISNTLTGVGFESGEVATPVAGGKLIVSGYWGIASFNPYRAFILRQN